MTPEIIELLPCGYSKMGATRAPISLATIICLFSLGLRQGLLENHPLGQSWGLADSCGDSEGMLLWALVPERVPFRLPWTTLGSQELGDPAT